MSSRQSDGCVVLFSWEGQFVYPDCLALPYSCTGIGTGAFWSHGFTFEAGPVASSIVLRLHVAKDHIEAKDQNCLVHAMLCTR